MSFYDRLAEIYDSMFGEAWYRRYARFIAKATGLRGGRMLDVACGTGRLGSLMRRFEVTGLDESAGMLARARRRGLAVRRGSIRSFRFERPFDLATCTFDSLNHLPSLGGTFRSVSRSLRPGGYFVFDLNTPYKFNAIIPGYRARHFRARGFEVFWLHECAPGRWTSRIFLFGRRRIESVIRERAFSRATVESALRSSHLDIVGVYSDLNFAPVHASSERWFFVTRKLTAPQRH